MVENLFWLGHSSFKITGEMVRDPHHPEQSRGKVIYIDPWQIKKGGEPANIILITHDHYDHCSAEDVKKIQNKDTIIVTISQCKGNLSGEIIIAKPNEKITVQGIEISTVPAYNLNKPFHPKANGHLGFIVNLNKKLYYHAGDTDFIPEMEKVKCDIALLPVSGTYVMTAEEAAKAVEKIKPALAIPMHYGSIVGSRKDAEQFKKLCKCPVEILELNR